MAMKKKNSNKIDGRDLNFNIMDVSSLLNKPSGFVKKDLKSLQFTQNAGKSELINTFISVHLAHCIASRLIIQYCATTV